MTAPPVYHDPACGPRSALTGSATDATTTRSPTAGSRTTTAAASGTPLVSNTKRNGPLFRQFGTAAQVTAEGTLMSPSPGENAATPDPTRVFPDMAQIVAGHTNAATGACPAAAGPAPVPQPTVDCYSEFLPTADWVGRRATTGRCTSGSPRATATRSRAVSARDDTAVKIAPKAGPFRVTSQATPQTVDGGSRLAGQLGRRRHRVGRRSNVSQVTIRLSLDGGKTFPIRARRRRRRTTAPKTVTLPNVAAPRAGSWSRRSATSSSTSRTPTCRSNFQGHGG